MNDNGKEITKYLAEVKRKLPFTCKVKKMLLEEIRQRIEELDTGETPITYELLVTEIGTPEEVASSFEDRESIAAFRKRSRRYSKAKVILGICAALLICAIVITIVVVIKNDSFYSNININQTVSLRGEIL